jgi:hypothetical protein
MIPSLYQELGTLGYSPFTTGHYDWDVSPNHITPQYISPPTQKQDIIIVFLGRVLVGV